MEPSFSPDLSSFTTTAKGLPKGCCCCEEEEDEEDDDDDGSEYCW